MNKRIIAICSSLVLIGCMAVGFVLLSAWHYHVTTPLTNGYSYWYSDDGPLIQLVSEERLEGVIKRDTAEFGCYWIPQVGPGLKSYRVYKNVITGYVSRPNSPSFGPGSSDRPYDPCATGYFFINLSNDRIYTGLSKTAWLGKLRQFGINEEPVLYKPSIFDGYNGHTKAE